MELASTTEAERAESKAESDRREIMNDAALDLFRCEALTAERRALQVINHDSKREFLNNLEWIHMIQDSIIPLLDSASGTTLSNVMAEMLKSNLDGVRKCIHRMLMQSVTSEMYVPSDDVINVQRFFLARLETHRLSIFRIHPGVPEWIALPALNLEVIMDSALRNARGHGKHGATYELTVNAHDDDLKIEIKNEAGARHKAALTLQEERVNILNNAHTPNLDGNALPSLPPFLPQYEERFEISVAKQILVLSIKATASLMFYPLCDDAPANTLLSIQVPFRLANAPAAMGCHAVLAGNTILICADDDAAPRSAYKGLAKALKINDCRIFGETFEGIAHLVQTVMAAAAQSGDENVVCIFDQNMDNYDEGAVYGTEVIKQCRYLGFTGLMFIRSANGDIGSRVIYKNAGANGTLSKLSTGMPQFVKDFMGMVNSIRDRSKSNRI